VVGTPFTSPKYSYKYRRILHSPVPVLLDLTTPDLLLAYKSETNQVKHSSWIQQHSKFTHYLIQVGAMQRNNVGSAG
jgi:hypothetical protein